MKATTTIVILCAAAALALAGCFNPGDAPGPFSCSQDDKRCPEGTTCGANNTCVKTKTDAAADGPNKDGAADAGPDNQKPDIAEPDIPKPDVTKPDALLDGPLKDKPDAALDAKQPDAAPDAKQPDTLLQDLQPDQLTPDLVAPSPDLLPADAGAPDWSGGPTCKHPPVIKACQDDPSGHTWCSVPAGCFTMGSPGSDKCRELGGAKEWETEHDVTLTNAIRVSATETTQGQFIRHMGYNPSQFSKCGRTCPADKVSWPEARAHCNALSRARGLTPCYSCTGWATPVSSCPDVTAFAGKKIYRCPGYRLPTEAEFEYAYRASTQTAYYSGVNDPLLCQTFAIPDPNAATIAWYTATAGTKTHPAATKKANAWGLYDMAGNVREWMQDGYKQDLGSNDATDPWTYGAYSMTRGGSYNDTAEAVRAAKREKGYTTATAKSSLQGFRCVRTVNPGLLAHWKLDGTVADSKGAYNGTFLGGSWVVGLKGKALSLDGKQHMATGYKPVLMKTDSVSFSAWVKVSKKAAMTVFGFQANTKGEVRLHLASDGTVIFGVTDDTNKGNKAQSTAVITDGFWHHLVGVRDGQAKELLLYVDGKLAQGVLDNTTFTINGSKKLAAALGAKSMDSGVTDKFDGTIDEVRVYDRALSPGEALEMYQEKPCDWTPVALKDLPWPRRVMGATEVDNGNVYLMGGSASASTIYLKSVLAYDIWTDTYSNLGYLLPYAMNVRSHSVARGDDGKFYISPSISSGTKGSRSKIVVFDPSSPPKGWEAKADIGTAHWGMSAVNGGDGKIYFMGGNSGAGWQTGIWAFDPKMDTIKKLAVTIPKTAAGEVAGALRASDGLIYLFTGAKHLVIFDPVGNTISTKAYPGGCSPHDVVWELPRGTVQTPCDSFKKILSYDLTTKNLTIKSMPSPFGGGDPSAVTVNRHTGSILTFGGKTASLYATKTAYRLDCMKH